MGHQLQIPGHLRKAFYREAEEEGLLSAARAGDELARDELAARIRPQLLAACIGVLGDDREAEDAVQDALAQAFEHLGQFEGRSRFSTWAHRIAINAAKMRKRKRRPQADSALVENVLDRQALDATQGSVFGAAAPPRPDHAAMLGAQRDRLRAALGRLEPQARKMVLGRAVDEASIAELAQDAGVSPQAAKSRLFRARARLRAEVGNLLT